MESRDHAELLATRSQLRMAHSELEKLRRQLDLFEAIDSSEFERPAWLSPKAAPRSHHAILCFLLSDAHFDEVVNPEELHGINAYNREIAELRLRAAFDGVVKLARRYITGVKFDGVCLMLGGDIFSGNIHEELQRTNADTLFGSLLHWLGPVAAGIELLSREFGQVHVSGVPGNHGRMTRKPIMKQRAADNLDWLFYRLLQRELRTNSKVTWNIPYAPSAHIKIYNTRYYMEHGDNFRGGSGISSAMSPLLLGAHRSSKQQAVAGSPYDYIVLGHWHQHIFLEEQGLIVGSTLKGFDEYGQNQIRAIPHPPSQALWLTTPEHGIGWSTRVLVQDRKAEGW